MEWQCGGGQDVGENGGNASRRGKVGGIGWNGKRKRIDGGGERRRSGRSRRISGRVLAASPALTFSFVRWKPPSHSPRFLLENFLVRVLCPLLAARPSIQFRRKKLISPTSHLANISSREYLVRCFPSCFLLSCLSSEVGSALLSLSLSLSRARARWFAERRRGTCHLRSGEKLVPYRGRREKNFPRLERN